MVPSQTFLKWYLSPAACLVKRTVWHLSG